MRQADDLDRVIPKMRFDRSVASLMERAIAFDCEIKHAAGEGNGPFGPLEITKLALLG